MENLQYNITPQDITALLRVSEQFGNNLDRYGQIFSDQQSNIAKSREDYASLMKRLLDREDSASTGNPFTDMLNGYIRMKKRNDQNYQWEGLLGSLFKKKTQPQPVNLPPIDPNRFPQYT